MSATKRSAEGGAGDGGNKNAKRHASLGQISDEDDEEFSMRMNSYEEYQLKDKQEEQLSSPRKGANDKDDSQTSGSAEMVRTIRRAGRTVKLCAKDLDVSLEEVERKKEEMRQTEETLEADKSRLQCVLYLSEIVEAISRVRRGKSNIGWLKDVLKVLEEERPGEASLDSRVADVVQRMRKYFDLCKQTVVVSAPYGRQLITGDDAGNYLEQQLAMNLNYVVKNYLGYIMGWLKLSEKADTVGTAEKINEYLQSKVDEAFCRLSGGKSVGGDISSTSTKGPENAEAQGTCELPPKGDEKIEETDTGEKLPPKGDEKIEETDTGEKKTDYEKTFGLVQYT